MAGVHIEVLDDEFKAGMAKLIQNVTRRYLGGSLCVSAAFILPRFFRDLPGSSCFFLE